MSGEKDTLEREVIRLQSLCERQRSKIQSLRSELTEIDPGRVSPPAPDPVAKAAEDSKGPINVYSTPLHLRLRLATKIQNSLIRSHLRSHAGRLFLRWLHRTQVMSRAAGLRREQLKVQVGMSQVRSARGELEGAREVAGRLRMEKACLIWVGRYREKRHKGEIDSLRESYEEEKMGLVQELKRLYFRMVKMNELEVQAVEAARERGFEGAGRIEKVERELKAAVLQDR